MKTSAQIIDLTQQYPGDIALNFRASLNRGSVINQPKHVTLSEKTFRKTNVITVFIALYQMRQCNEALS